MTYTEIDLEYERRHCKSLEAEIASLNRRWNGDRENRNRVLRATSWVLAFSVSLNLWWLIVTVVRWFR